MGHLEIHPLDMDEKLILYRVWTLIEGKAKKEL
jgi:hypothetical protein